MKKIILTVFLTLASLGVLANNFLPVSAPTLIGEMSDAQNGEPEPQAQNGSLPNSFVRISPAHISQNQTAPQKPLSSPASAPVVVEAPEPAPAAESEPVPASDTDVIKAAPETASFVTESGRVLESEWLEVPLSVFKEINGWHSARQTSEGPSAASPEIIQAKAIEARQTAEGHRDAKPADNSMRLFLAAVSELPSSMIDWIRSRPIPAAPAVPEILTYTQDLHVAGGDSPLATAAENFLRTPAAAKPENFSFQAYVSNSSAIYLPNLDQIRLRPVPVAPVMPKIVAPEYVSNWTQTPLPSLEQIRFRPVLEAPVMPKMVAPEYVSNWTQTPLPSLEQIRFRAVLEAPVMPKMIAPEYVSNWTQTPLPSLEQIRFRAALEAPVMPKMIAPQVVSNLSQNPLPSIGQMWSRPFAEVPVMPKFVSPEKAIIAITHSRSALIESAFSESDAAKTAAEFTPVVFAKQPQAPSATFETVAFAPVQSPPPASAPSAPVQVVNTAEENLASTLAENSTSVADPSVTISQAPALIGSHFAFSNEILKPLGIGPLPSAMLLAESLADSSGAHSGGPSPEWEYGRSLAAPDLNSQRSGPAGVLINAKTEFSADLLKPFNSAQNSAKPSFLSEPGANGSPAAKADGGYCDPNFVGQPIRFSQTVELKLDDLLSQLHSRFGVNFIMGPAIGQLPLNVKAGSIPWNVLLRSQLFISGVRARCIDTNTIELIQNSVLPSLQDQADVKTRFIKLKFLQRTSGGSVDLANRSQGGQNGGQGGCGGQNGGQSGGGSGGGFGGGGGGGGGQGQQGQTAGQQGNNKFDKLIIEIEKILGIRSMTQSSVGGGVGGGQTAGGSQTEERRTNRSVTQIPGRNILVIKATDEEFELINRIIALADRPPYQVVIKGLVYSANQDRLRDIGVQTTITGSAGPSNNPNGGIFGHTLGAGGTLFDFSTIIGTFDFNVQATALQQNGVISVKSRPFTTVLDGLCTVLDVGRQLPIVIDSTLGGQGDVVFVNASNNLSVTPYVVDDDNGNPVAVTLELVLRANDVDSSVTTRGVPAISTREMQTQLLLSEDKTAILGGFTLDQDSKTVSKTPGLGDIPIIGELFKRRVRDSRVNRLYFALSVSVVPYGEVIRPVDVPGATTDPPSITPEMKKRADESEPKQVVAPKKSTDH